MKRVAATYIVLQLSLGLMVSTALAADCTQCDCIHLPCPKECKPCCGLATGKIAFIDNQTLVLNGEKYHITLGTKIQKDLIEGSQATVFFRKSADGNQATKIVASPPKASGPG